MKRRARAGRPNQKGIAAVEFALVLPVLILLIAFTQFFGRMFWNYTVALKAAHDAATIVAMASNSEIATMKSDSGEIEISKIARQVAQSELAALNTNNVSPATIDITCDAGTCRGDAVPTDIVVMVKMKMVDFVLPFYTNEVAGPEGMSIHAEVRVKYVGS